MTIISRLNGPQEVLQVSHSCRRDSGREKSDLRSARAADTQRGRGSEKVAAGKSFSAVQAKEAGALWSALYGKALEWVNKAATSCFNSGRDKHWESQRRRENKDKLPDCTERRFPSESAARVLLPSNITISDPRGTLITENLLPAPHRKESLLPAIWSKCFH